MNVHGGFSSRYQLSAIQDTLKPLFSSGTVSIDSVPEMADSLVLSSDLAFFHTLFIGGVDGYLLDGAVNGTVDEVIAFVRKMSVALANAGIEHDLHVEGEDGIYLASFPLPSNSPRLQN